ncbi:MAG: tetratricopeptide repeat protein [Candidatus Omnitrophota bacterium]|nr:tetratricopeptide repeat protein [Candidatus Omnitrophota bacterium]
MQFFRPDAFLVLWALPLIAGLFIVAARLRSARLKKFGDLETIEPKLIAGYRKSQFHMRAIYLLLVFLFATLALARPQWGDEKRKIERKGVDVIFMIDTSLSMLAEDIKPNRFEKAKLEIKSLVRQLSGDRVGMVAFAGTSFLQSPLTLDYAAFFLFLDAIKVGYIPDPGTSLAAALRRATGSFPEKQLKHKAIVVFTDGEDHEGGMDTILPELKEAGVRIYTIGTGTADGDPIPLSDDKGDRKGYKKDRRGEVVITRLNDAVLKTLSEETGGLYFPSSPSEKEIGVILKHMESLGQKHFKEKLVTDREDHYQLFLVLSLLFLILEMLVQRRVAPKAAETAAVLLAFVLFSGFIETPHSLNEKGNALFEEKKYDSALEAYRKAQIKEPDDPAIRYNLGTTLYQKHQFREALQHLEQSVKSVTDPELKARALYNYGNTLVRLGDFEKAIEIYQKALEINPDDTDAKYNLEFLQRSKNKFEKQDQDRKQDSQKQDQKQDKPQPKDEQQKSDQQQSEDQQQNQPQQQEQDNKDQDEKNQDQQDPEDQKGESEKEDQKEEHQDDQQKKQEPEKQDEEGEEQPASPEDQEGDEEEQEDKQEKPDQGDEREEEMPQPGQEPPQRSKQPLQGQMSMDNALRLLDALKDAEKDLQDLRRPPTKSAPISVEKDW